MLAESGMLSNFFRSSLLSATMSVAVATMPVCAAAQKSAAKKRSIAVCPIMDGDADEKSRELSYTIADSLRLISNHHIIDSEVVADVAAYHGGHADASATTREAQDILSLAKDRYFQFRYEDAREGLTRAISILEASRGDVSQAGPLLVDAYVSQAVVAKSLGDVASAREAFSKALAVNPKLDLSDEEYPPSVAKLFEEERARVAGKPAGSIRATSSPEVADVYVNGIRMGVTPLLLEGMPAGRYHVLIRASQYGELARTVDVAAGARAKVRGRLGWHPRESKPESVEEDDAAAKVREGVRIADLLKADKVILVDADLSETDSGMISARMVDGRLRAGQKPIALSVSADAFEDPEGLADMVDLLAEQADSHVLADRIDPAGMSDPILLAKRRRPLARQPLFWGAIGTAVAGAIAGGVAAAMSGGGAKTGSVKVEFR